MGSNDEPTPVAQQADEHLSPTLAHSMIDADNYCDQQIADPLTKSDINQMAVRSLLLQASFNYERMQAAGWLYQLIPALRKIHNNPDDLKLDENAYGIFQRASI